MGECTVGSNPKTYGPSLIPIHTGWGSSNFSRSSQRHTGHEKYDKSIPPLHLHSTFNPEISKHFLLIFPSVYSWEKSTIISILPRGREWGTERLSDLTKVRQVSSKVGNRTQVSWLSECPKFQSLGYTACQPEQGKPLLCVRSHTHPCGHFMRLWLRDVCAQERLGEVTAGNRSPPAHLIFILNVTLWYPWEVLFVRLFL